MTETHEPKVGPVFAFTAKRADVERFWREIVGLSGDPGDDATWFATSNADVVVHAPDDAETPPEIARSTGFVVWVEVADAEAAYRRARAAGSVVGPYYGDYFFVKDPDGRFVGLYSDHGHDDDHAH